MAEYTEPQSNLKYETIIKKPKNRYLLHIALFVITFITTTIAGAFWTTGTVGPYTFEKLAVGLPYSISILFILTMHEFGHYFAAKAHGVDATLPFYIPFPPFPGMPHFGTMGAVIKTRSKVSDNKAMFDIGVAGPLAGFVAVLIVLIYGFTHLPDKSYILAIHPDYFDPGYTKGIMSLRFGDTLLFSLFRYIFTEPGQFFPPMSEIYHYPYLCTGWFGLLITAMNMIPVGQLDGGHVVYSMFGPKTQEKVSGIAMLVLIGLGMLGALDLILELNMGFGWTGWLFWAGVLYFVIKIKHPPVYRFDRLNNTRLLLGWIALAILLLAFSPAPFVLYGG